MPPGQCLVSVGSKSFAVEQARIWPIVKAAGYDAVACRAAGCSWADVKTAGFTAVEARAAGCDVATAKTEGYDLLSLVGSFGYDDVAAAGVDLSSCMLVSVTPCARKLRLTPPPSLPSHSTSARRPQLVRDAASSQSR